MLFYKSQPFCILEPNGCDLAVNGCDFNIYKLSLALLQLLSFCWQKTGEIRSLMSGQTS